MSAATAEIHLATIAHYRGALKEIAALAMRCGACNDETGRAVATHRTTLWGMPFFLCAEHAPIQVEAHRKAESKGSGRQPPVEPYEQPEAVRIALAALEKPTKDATSAADGTACTPSSVAPCIRTRDFFESRFIPTADGFTAYVFGREKLPGGAHRRHFTLVVGDDGWSLTMVDKLTGDVRAIDLDERGVDMKAVFKGAAAFLRGPEPDDAKGAW